MSMGSGCGLLRAAICSWVKTSRHDVEVGACCPDPTPDGGLEAEMGAHPTASNVPSFSSASVSALDWNEHVAEAEVACAVVLLYLDIIGHKAVPRGCIDFEPERERQVGTAEAVGKTSDRK